MTRDHMRIRCNETRLTSTFQKPPPSPTIPFISNDINCHVQVEQTTERLNIGQDTHYCVNKAGVRYGHCLRPLETSTDGVYMLTVITKLQNDKYHIRRGQMLPFTRVSIAFHNHNGKNPTEPSLPDISTFYHLHPLGTRQALRFPRRQIQSKNLPELEPPSPKEFQSISPHGEAPPPSSPHRPPHNHSLQPS